MGVYKVVLRPNDRKVVGSKWVFCIKCGSNRNIEKYKVQVVTQGFAQVEGLDYNETFAPVTKFLSFHTVLALTTQLRLEVHQMDVKATYLNRVLKEEIYMESWIQCF